jgi:hypothetical protein
LCGAGGAEAVQVEFVVWHANHGATAHRGAASRPIQ